MIQQLENKTKFMLERFPVLKKTIKRCYQIFFCTITGSWKKTKGNIVRLSPEDGYEYFFGYYDKSPVDFTDRFILMNKAEKTYKEVAPKEPIELCVLDIVTHEITKINTVFSWNNQQGCMAQWLGPDFSKRIIYNDFRNGEYCSVVYNWELKKEEDTIPSPIYDVSKDGKVALALDFNRLHRLRPGYGYSNSNDHTKGQLCPDEYCIWKIDLKKKTVEGLIKYTDFWNFEHDESMDGAEHKVNHIMINPSGDRFMVIHRWIKNGKKRSRLITVNIDGSDMYNLSDDIYVSHCFWRDDKVIISFLRKKEYGDHYYLLKDKTGEYEMIWPSLVTDGHCSFSHDKQSIVTDTYPNRCRMSTIYVSKEGNDPKAVARVFSPFKYDNECRCDLHPRWNYLDNKIYFDSAHEGKRALYYIDY